MTTNIDHRRAIARLRKAGYSVSTPGERLPWHPIRMPTSTEYRCYLCGETVPAGALCWFETVGQAAHSACYDEAKEKIA